MSPDGRITRRFRDRAEAGRVLAGLLDDLRGRDDVVVLGLPRGGVPVAAEIARALDAPLDVLIVRKLGVPGYAELAMGAIASGGVRTLNRDVVESLRLTDDAVAAVAAQEQHELQRRERLYRGDRPGVPLRDRVVVLVDDGLATGASMRAAVEAVRAAGPREVVVAVPVAAPEICREFEGRADRVVCAATPQPFQAVGLWYEQFDQVPDSEVRALLVGAGEAGGAR